VQHAHQKGIIHRDLKPTNVLVTEHDGKSVSKVIDFGLAKALHTPGLLTEKTLFTEFGTAVGTPLYMAPEQVGINALDVDTRVDIYALGVLLYELLTGTTPVERQRLKAAVWDEVRRLIREEEPPRPSQRLSASDALPSIAACRDTEPAKLGRLVRGDLDWIVMKALEKDRNRRYETATAFAEDVRRFQADEVVAAGPPTLGYRLRKFVRRNRAAVVAVGIIGLAVLLAVGGLTWGLVQTRWALDRVTEEEQKTREALTEADAQRKKAETSAASLRIDLDLSEVVEKVRLLRLARTLQSIPDHSRELREYLTLKVLSEGQTIEPLVARFTHDELPVEYWRSFLSPDGRSVLIGGTGKDGDEFWQVCDTLTGRPVVTLPPGERADLNAFMEAGRLLSFREDDRVACLWDSTGKLTLVTAPFPRSIRNVALSPDHRRLLVVVDPTPSLAPEARPPGSHVELLDASDGRRIAVLRGHTGSIRTVAFSPDGRWLVTCGHDGTARAWTAEEGRLVRTVEGLPEEVPWIGMNPAGTFACTIAKRELRWWSLPDWQSAGPPSPIGTLRNGGIWLGTFAHPDVVSFFFDEETSSSVVVYRRGDREALELLSGPEEGSVPLHLASDGRKVLAHGGAVYDLNDSRRLQLPPPGRKYHPDARAILGGRLFLQHATILDLATEKEIDAGRYCRPLKAPGCLCVGDGSKDALILTPSLDIDIPRASLELWAQVVVRGELNGQGEFLKWDEPTWERKRQELAATAPRVGAFPFPGRVAQDRLYWLRQEIEETSTRLDGSVGKIDEVQEAKVMPLLDRLVVEEPGWQNHLRRGEFARWQGKHGLASRDLLEAGRLAGPRFWRWMATSARGLAGSAASYADLRPDDYEAALTLVGKVASETESDETLGTLLYRLGRYPEAVQVLSRRDWHRFGTVFAAASSGSPWAVPLPIPKAREMITPNAVAAMCLFRMGRNDLAKPRLALARRVAEQEKETYAAADPRQAENFEKYSPLLHYLREAEALIEGKERAAPENHP
jgi:hypothetical protein